MVDVHILTTLIKPLLTRGFIFAYFSMGGSDYLIKVTIIEKNISCSKKIDHFINRLFQFRLSIPIGLHRNIFRVVNMIPNK